MAEETATPDTTNTETATVTEVTKVEEPLGDAGKKALEAERKNARQAARERDALAAELQAAEDRAVQAESKALRLEVAFEKGLTPAQAKRLVGATREELEADADELLETFKPTEQPKPDVDLDLGNRPTATPNLDPKSRDLAQIESDLKAAKRR